MRPNTIIGLPWWLSSKESTCNAGDTEDVGLMEKEMATHSSVLAWRIPGTGEPGWLQSMGLHRVRHDWSNLAAAAATSLPTLTLDSPRIYILLWICQHPAQPLIMTFHSQKIIKTNGLKLLQQSSAGDVGQEDVLEKKMAITPVFLPGKSHG